MYDYQLTQTKERIAALLTEINEKTDEVERLVKEEKCLVEEDKKNNTCLQDVLAKIVCAEENYVAAQMVVTEANKAHVIRLKVYNDQRDAIANCTNLQQKTMTEDEMEANKVFYTAFDTAEKKLKKAQEFYDNKNKEFNTIVSNKIHELENKQFYDRRNTPISLWKEIHETKEWKENEFEYHQTCDEFYRAREDLNSNKIKFNNELHLSWGTMWKNLEKSDAYIELNKAAEVLQVARNIESDALQKYKTEKLNFFKAHLTYTLSNTKEKCSNFEKVETMFNQITQLQNWYQQKIKALEEKHIEENHKNFEKFETMFNQITQLQNWYQETKIREEKRANAIDAFLEERHKF